MLLFLAAVLVYAGLLTLVNSLIMAFIGNLHHAAPEIVPALSYGDTFSLMIPIYLLGIFGLIKNT